MTGPVDDETGLVEPQLTPKAHRHVEGGVCLVCFESGENDGFVAGADSGREEAMRHSDYVRAEQADELRQVAETAHCHARHGGRFGVCRDVMCAAVELWLHFESRQRRVVSDKTKRRVVRG